MQWRGYIYSQIIQDGKITLMGTEVEVTDQERDLCCGGEHNENANSVCRNSE